MTGATVFVYGTLMAPEVLQTLIKRVPQHQPGAPGCACCMCIAVCDQVQVDNPRDIPLCPSACLQRASRATSGTAYAATSFLACSRPGQATRSAAWCVRPQQEAHSDACAMALPESGGFQCTCCLQCSCLAALSACCVPRATSKLCSWPGGEAGAARPRHTGARRL